MTKILVLSISMLIFFSLVTGNSEINTVHNDVNEELRTSAVYDVFPYDSWYYDPSWELRIEERLWSESSSSIGMCSQTFSLINDNFYYHMGTNLSESTWIQNGILQISGRWQWSMTEVGVDNNITVIVNLHLMENNTIIESQELYNDFVVNGMDATFEEFVNIEFSHTWIAGGGFTIFGIGTLIYYAEKYDLAENFKEGVQHIQDDVRNVVSDAKDIIKAHTDYAKDSIFELGDLIAKTHSSSSKSVSSAVDKTVKKIKKKLKLKLPWWEPMKVELGFLIAYGVTLTIANIISNQIFWNSMKPNQMRKGN